jgi:hypothetical protein
MSQEESPYQPLARRAADCHGRRGIRPDQAPCSDPMSMLLPRSYCSLALRQAPGPLPNSCGDPYLTYWLVPSRCSFHHPSMGTPFPERRTLICTSPLRNGRLTRVPERRRECAASPNCMSKARGVVCVCNVGREPAYLDVFAEYVRRNRNRLQGLACMPRSWSPMFSKVSHCSRWTTDYTVHERTQRMGLMRIAF